MCVCVWMVGGLWGEGTFMQKYKRRAGNVSYVLRRPPTPPPPHTCSCSLPPAPRRRMLTVKETGWMPGMPAGATWRVINTRVTCTGNVTHDLPPDFQLVEVSRLSRTHYLLLSAALGAALIMGAVLAWCSYRRGAWGAGARGAGRGGVGWGGVGLVGGDKGWEGGCWAAAAAVGRCCLGCVGSRGGRPLQPRPAYTAPAAARPHGCLPNSPPPL